MTSQACNYELFAFEKVAVVWTAVRRLKAIGLEVVLVVADGISNNRRFFKLHRNSEGTRNGIF